MNTKARSHQTLERPSLVISASNSLRCRILSGEWADGFPGERPLAIQMGISRPTLRKALGMLEQDGLLGTASRRPRTVPGSALQTRTGTAPASIAFLTPIPDAAMPQFTLLWLGMLRESFKDRGVHFEVRVQPGCFGARFASELEKTVASIPHATWILYLSTPEMQQWFIRKRIRCVVAGTPFNGNPLASVDIDYREICRHAVGRLAALGRRRMVLLLPESRHGGDEESMLGFDEAIQRIPGTEGVVLRHDGTAGGVARIVARSMHQLPAPDGWIVARSHYALAAHGALSVAGARLAGKVSLICRDDDPFLAFTFPEIARYQAAPHAYARAMIKAVESVRRKRIRSWKLESLFIRQER